MKYLKKYESNWTSPKYQKGDLVIIDSDWLENVAKIINVLPYNNFFQAETEYKLECKTQLRLDMNDRDVIISAKEDEIVRKLTPSEIIEYNLQDDVKKYNL